MKVTIDVSDFYLGEDDQLEAALKAYIIGQVERNVFASIEKRVEEHIERRVKQEVESRMALFINKTIANLIDTENIIINQKPIAISEHIKNVFQSSYRWNNPTEAIKKLADQFGKELKARYDIQFASHVVAKLNEQGMLKDDVAKMLLPEKSK